MIPSPLATSPEQLTALQKLGALLDVMSASPLLRDWPLTVDGIPIGGLDKEPAFLPIEGHSITIGAPGEGKFTSVIAPLALHDVRDDDGLACGMVFIDPKNGEAAKVTRAFREHLRGEMTFVLDPYGLAGGSDAINPFDFIDPAATDFFEQCAGLAKALIVQRPRDKRGNDFIWDARGAGWLTATIGYLAREPGEERTVMRIRQIFSLDEEGLKQLLGRMQQQSGAPAFIVNGATDMRRVTSKAEREASGYIATIMEATEFADSALMAGALKRSTFDPIVVRSHGATVYIVAPDIHLQTCAPWLRLISETIRQRIMRSPLRRQVHWVIDEAKAFDAWSFIDNGLRALRSANISLHLFYQNIGQLKAVWGEGWSSLTDTKVVRFLGSSDVETCRWIAELAGETTVVEYARADNQGESSAHARGKSITRGSSHAVALADGQSWGQSSAVAEAIAKSQAKGRTVTDTEQRGTSRNDSHASSRGFNTGQSTSRVMTQSRGYSVSTSTTRGGAFSGSYGANGASHSLSSSGSTIDGESFTFGSSISLGLTSTTGRSDTSTRTSGFGESHSASQARGHTDTETESSTHTDTRSRNDGGTHTHTATESHNQSQGETETDTATQTSGVTITKTERRRLLTVDEVRQLDRAKMIVFVDRSAAHLVDRLHYHRSAPLLARVLEGEIVQAIHDQTRDADD